MYLLETVLGESAQRCVHVLCADLTAAVEDSLQAARTEQKALPGTVAEVQRSAASHAFYWLACRGRDLGGRHVVRVILRSQGRCLGRECWVWPTQGDECSPTNASSAGCAWVNGCLHSSVVMMMPFW